MPDERGADDYYDRHSNNVDHPWGYDHDSRSDDVNHGAGNNNDSRSDDVNHGAGNNNDSRSDDVNHFDDHAGVDYDDDHSSDADSRGTARHGFRRKCSSWFRSFATCLGFHRGGGTFFEPGSCRAPS